MKLVCKDSDDGTGRFQVTAVTWKADGTCNRKEPVRAERPPREGVIWIEALSRPDNQTDLRLFARLFKRPAGQIVCRANSVTEAIEELMVIRRSLGDFKLEESIASRTVERPDVSLGLPIDIEACQRVLVKIGVNLCAKLYGADSVRAPWFAEAIRFVRTGEGKVYELSREDWQPIAKLLNLSRKNAHALLLWPVPTPDGIELHFAPALYGNPLSPIVLANVPREARWSPKPLLVLVHYNEHRMTQEHGSLLLAAVSST